MIPYMLTVAFPLGLVLLLLLGGRRKVCYECDLCGRHVECVQFQTAKAVADHVCRECARMEMQCR
jgi:hypothetical protein